VEPPPAEAIKPGRDGGFDQRRVWVGPHLTQLAKSRPEGPIHIARTLPSEKKRAQLTREGFAGGAAC
jgi:hypothetical protein